MDHSTQDYKMRDGVHHKPHHPDHRYTHARDDSTASGTHTELSTIFSSGTTDASTYLTSPTIVTSQLTPPKQQQKLPAMTTYYQYDQFGKLVSASQDDPLAQAVLNRPDCISYVEAGDEAGAYLPQREVVYPVLFVSNHAHVQSWPAERPAIRPEAYGGIYNAYPGYHAPGNPDSYHAQVDRYPDHAGSFGFAGFASQSNQLYPYPNPETIRHLHTLQSLLPHLQPERKLKAVEGMTIDIVEEGTGTIFAQDVPKRMLVLFLGRNVVDRFVVTVGRKDVPNWRMVPRAQEMRIPRGHGSQSALRILMAWMSRACSYITMGCMKQFKVPHDTLAACTLAQVLELFGLHKDAMRVDHAITKDHFHRPIHARELERLWNGLGEESRYTYAAIKIVGQRLDDYHKNAEWLEQMWEEILEILEEYPPLEARVKNLDLNEKYRPTFETEWSIKQPSFAQNPGPDNGDPAKNSFSWPWPAPGSNRATPGSKALPPTTTPMHTSKVSVLRILSSRDVPAPTELAASESE